MFVHGSGPTSRDGYGYLPALWEEFANRGVASLSWDKPGVGESSGNWKHQSNHDRALECSTAIKFLREQDEIRADQIGIWGISQAGWVVPKVFSMLSSMSFLIVVSVPHSTGADQEIYRVSQALPADGYSSQDVTEALRFTRKRLNLIRNGAPFEAIAELQAEIAHVTWASDVGILDQEGCQFLTANAFETPVDDIKSVQCPTLAVFGARDLIIDWRSSVSLYQHSLKAAGNNDLTVKVFPSADHALFSTKTGGFRELQKSFSLDDKPYAPGYLATMADWLSGICSNT